MLSIFPELYTFELAAPFALRITTGAFMIYLATRMYRGLYNETAGTPGLSLLKKWVELPLLVISALAGILLVIGLFVQPAALVTAAIAILLAFNEKSKHVTIIFPSSTYILLAIISFSLLVLGPGLFAFDLPL